MLTQISCLNLYVVRNMWSYGVLIFKGNLIVSIIIEESKGTAIDCVHSGSKFVLLILFSGILFYILLFVETMMSYFRDEDHVGK